MLNYARIFLTLSQSEKRSREEIKAGDETAERITWKERQKVWEREKERRAAEEEKFSKNEVI